MPPRMAYAAFMLAALAVFLLARRCLPRSAVPTLPLEKQAALALAAFLDGVPRHPTQVYESLFHLTMAGALLWLMAHDRLRTHRLQLYLIAYGVFRFLTEFLRPEPEWFAGLTFFQWAAVVLVVGPAGQ